MDHKLRHALKDESADLSSVGSFFRKSKEKRFDQSMNPYHVSRRVWEHLFDINSGSFKKNLTLEDIQRTVLKLGGRVNQELNYLEGRSTTFHSSFPLHRLLKLRPKNYRKMVQFLLAHGADPNLKDSERGGAIMYVDPSKDSTLLKLLLKYKAQLETADNEGKGYAFYYFTHYVDDREDKKISKGQCEKKIDRLIPLIIEHKKFWLKNILLRKMLRSYMFKSKNFQTKKLVLKKLQDTSLQRKFRATEIRRAWKKSGYAAGITVMNCLKGFDGRM